MARSPKLKVYRTPIGFHDAYVAAPSQKAALAAWGSEHDLFARGVAELVTDPDLIAEPLAHPGQVVKRLRGTAAEQIAALPPDKPKPKSNQRRQQPEDAAPAPTAPVPPPSRAALDEAEQRIAEAERRHRTADTELRREEEKLAQRRRELERRRSREIEALDRARKAAQDSYEEAMRNWRSQD